MKRPISMLAAAGWLIAMTGSAFAQASVSPAPGGGASTGGSISGNGSPSTVGGSIGSTTPGMAPSTTTGMGTGSQPNTGGINQPGVPNTSIPGTIGTGASPSGLPGDSTSAPGYPSGVNDGR